MMNHDVTLLIFSCVFSGGYAIRCLNWLYFAEQRLNRFIDRENELRQSKPPAPQPPQRPPMDPWTRSKLCKQFAPPKEEKFSEPDA